MYKWINVQNDDLKILLGLINGIFKYPVDKP